MVSYPLKPTQTHAGKTGGPPEPTRFNEVLCAPMRYFVSRAKTVESLDKIQISIYLCGFVRSTFNVSEGIRFV